MSDQMERFSADLEGCGCCEGTEPQTPKVIDNRSGLDTVSYRIGTHSTFKASLLAAMSSSRHPGLLGLRTRDDDDFSIALSDAFATMADVLTFYQERGANENWLRTAEERFSVRELARLLGYELDPGVAADVLLAFQLVEAPGLPAAEVGRTTIPVATQVQSTPGPDEDPHLFETTEEIEGRVAWNRIQPPTSTRHPLTGSENPLLFEGVATQIKAGDAVLYDQEHGGHAFALVKNVEPVAEQNTTAVFVDYISSQPTNGLPPYVQLPDPLLSQPAGAVLGQSKTADELTAEALSEGFDPDELLRTFQDNPKPSPRVIVFRTSAAVFGHNAQDWDALPLTLKVQQKEYEIQSDGSVTLAQTSPAPFTESTWIDGKTLDDLDEGSRFVHLDSTYDQVAEGDVVVLRDGDTWAIYDADAATTLSHTGFNLATKITRLKLNVSTGFGNFDARRTTVFAQSEALPLARKPLESPYGANEQGWLQLSGWVPGLGVGQRVVVEGRVLGDIEENRSEAAVLERVEYDLSFEGGTRVQINPPLANLYQRDQVAWCGNVAAATHGESTEEILGSGNAAETYQTFELKQPPLTHTSAANPAGRESTLEVRVNGVLWSEVPTLYGSGPEDRIYTTVRNDDGTTLVRFGDGETGARLPSGTNNVRASYRKGIGLAARVRARQLDVLLTRPLGLESAINPLPAEGGADPEGLEQARENAPSTVLTLGRAVSITDYEDLARTFPGVAKAQATWVWSGRERGIYVTVALDGGAPLATGGTLWENLYGALRSAGDPHVPLDIGSYRAATFRLRAGLHIDAAYLEDDVLDEVEQTLRSCFSFEQRRFGQPVAASEVIATTQGVEGVVAVDLDHLYRSGDPEARRAILPAAQPLLGSRTTIEPAELLSLDPDPDLGLYVVSP